MILARMGDDNILKCEVLKGINQQNPVLYTYHIKGFPIKEVTFVKYLWVTIENKLTFKYHIQAITSKANQTNTNFLFFPSVIKLWNPSLIRSSLKPPL